MFILNIAYHFDAATISLLEQWNAIIIIQIELKHSVYMFIFNKHNVLRYIYYNSYQNYGMREKYMNQEGTNKKHISQENIIYSTIYIKIRFYFHKCGILKKNYSYKTEAQVMLY